MKIFKISLCTIIIINIFLFVTIFSCSNNRENQNDILKRDLNDTTINFPPQKIFIKDTLKYSMNFINNIKNWNSGELQFIDSLLIIGNDTALISTKLLLNKKKTFCGCEGEICNGCGKDSICYLLVLERINYSTIKYRIEKTVKHIKSYVESGSADLDHNFYYLDSDNEYEDELKFYSELETPSKKPLPSNTGNLTVRIGTNGDGIFFAKLERPFCKDETREIYNCPTLYEKNKTVHFLDRQTITTKKQRTANTTYKTTSNEE